MSGATLPYCGERSVAALPGGAKPFAGRVGWRGLPLRTNKGADSGFRRTIGIHPRRAKRRAQVCGDSTVKSNRRWAGSPHPPQAVPLPLRGEGLNAREAGRDLQCRARHFPNPASEALPYCPKFEDSPNLERAIVLPLEGKGDRSAVDEVNCTHAPLRGA